MTWITNLDAAPDISSRIRREPRMITQEFGDGHIARIPDGINNQPREYTLAYRNITVSDHAKLLAFVPPLAGNGTTVTVPLWPEVPAGNTTALFYVREYDFSSDEGGNVWQWTIRLREVFV